MNGFVKKYGVDATNAMALGLFGSLIIGLVLKNLGGYLSVDFLITFGQLAQKTTGAAVAIAIAYSFRAPILVLVSCVAVGVSAYEWGNVMGCFVATVVAVETGKFVSKRTILDILITPIVTLLVGLAVAYYAGKPITLLMDYIGQLIVLSMELQPLLMSVVLAVLFGIILTLPVSSAALAIALSLSGEAAGAATIGCCAQMVGFAAMSYRDNNFGGVLSLGVGTSMLQMPNIIRNPKIFLPPILTSALLAPIAITYFHLTNISVAAGMGTSGLVGQMGTFEAMGLDVQIVLIVLVFHFIAPAILCFIFYKIFMHFGWIREGDLKLSI